MGARQHREWMRLGKLLEDAEKFTVMQKHSTTWKYSILAISSHEGCLAVLDKWSKSVSLYPPVCYNPAWTSHSPALSHISSSLPLWSPAVNFPSKPLGHDWHDLGGGFNSLKGLSWLRPVSCYHYHRQAVAVRLDPPSPLLELCGGSRGILTSPKQASLVGQCVFVCCFYQQ